MDFALAFPATMVRFGPHRSTDLPAVLSALGAERALLLGSAGAIDRNLNLIAAWGTAIAATFDEVEAHCPEPVAQAALKRYRDARADSAVAIGGGSTIGLGKFIRKQTGAPLVVLPTTYSGSEMTAIYGMKIGAEKRTWTDAAARASAVLYDPGLTTTLPPFETATTGMNCLAHLVEGLYGPHTSPPAIALAERGIAALRDYLPVAVERPEDRTARAEALLAGYLGGLVVSLAGIALHHRICHVLGGLHGLPHGASNSVILPYALAYNAPAAPGAMDRLKGIFRTDDPAGAIYDFARSIGAPGSLKDAGMPATGTAEVAEATIATLSGNPRSPSPDSLVAMLDDAWSGRRPRRY